MNQLFSCMTLYLCILCLFTLVIHADTTETTKNVDIVNSDVEVSQGEPNTSPSQTMHNLPPSSPSSINNNEICHVIGECVPCDVLEAKIEDYCRDFGNKEPIECHWDTPDNESAGNSTRSFQSCKRVKRFERTKYFEFQFINILIAFMSCSIFLWRRGKLTADGYRRLSRRIRGSTL